MCILYSYVYYIHQSQLIAYSVCAHLHKASKQHIAFGMLKQPKKGTRMFGEYTNHPRKISKVRGKTFKFYVTKQDFTHATPSERGIHTIFRIT